MTTRRGFRGGAPRRVVIVGGGVAALETLLALRELAGHQLELTLLSSDHEFVYRPVTVGEAFDRSEARAYDLAEIVGQRPADRFILGGVSRVYVDEHVVVGTDGALHPYDSLVVATGAVMVDPLPGALTFRGRDDVPALRALLDDLDSSQARSVAIAIATERSWPLPGYELALLTAAHLRDSGSAARVILVTPEEAPLALFGPAAAAAVEPLLTARGVVVRTLCRPAVVRPGALVLAGGSEIHVDRVITMPTLEGPRLAGLPCDELGFIPTDAHGRVPDCPDVYAAGDATAFPLKQGGLAAQQADAVAETLAAEAGGALTPEPFRPILRGLLMTGGAPLYLRAEPQRLARASSVAIEAMPARPGTQLASAAAGQPLWWPPAKIAGRYLAPYLATAHSNPLSRTVLSDRTPLSDGTVRTGDVDDALELALMLADCDARWGDLGAALEALDAAEALTGSLPPEYEAKRREWVAARRRP